MTTEHLAHYCSAEAFCSIISNREIRLSSLRSANDSTEGKLISDTFNRIGSKLQTPQELSDEIIENIKSFEEIYSARGFCLSERPDILSQWRAYADDGRGFSIVFSAEYIQSLVKEINNTAVTTYFCQAVYSELEQEENMMSAYHKILNELNSNKRWVGFKAGTLSQTEFDEFRGHKRRFWAEIAKPIRMAYTLKHHTFFEECEWRIFTFADSIFGNRAKFYASNKSIKSYLRIKLNEMECKPISKIILGPKNTSSMSEVAAILDEHEFGGVKIEKSSTPYK